MNKPRLDAKKAYGFDTRKFCLNPNKEIPAMLELLHFFAFLYGLQITFTETRGLQRGGECVKHGQN
jgi:hypothetical protein